MDKLEICYVKKKVIFPWFGLLLPLGVEKQKPHDNHQRRYYNDMDIVHEFLCGSQ